MGLDPHKHLGRSIAEMQPLLHRARTQYGCNVCGEGGEYETLTLDCPMFTHARIVLDAWEVPPPLLPWALFRHMVDLGRLRPAPSGT